MTNRKEANVNQHVLDSIQEENNADQKEQMVIASDHVFCADIKEGGNSHTLVIDQKLLRALIYTVSEGDDGKQTNQYYPEIAPRNFHFCCRWFA